MKSKYRLGLPLVAAMAIFAVTQEASMALAQAATAPSSATPPYKVVDGNKVDESTMVGWRTWRAMACERCHGANQEGLVGPSLIESLKVLSKEDFVTTVTNGRAEKGMPNFGGVESVTKNIDNLYAYLKGRSDGAIKPGHLKKLEQ